jgi:hypothetical protein
MDEPTACALMDPPGFGKTEAVRHAAETVGAVYLRLSASTCPLIASTLAAFNATCEAFRPGQARAPVSELLR